MMRVYVAGKMGSTDPLEFLRNLNTLQEWTARVRELGFAPFPVADDYADIMRTTGVSMQMVKEASLAWLRVADCMFVTPDWEHSMGTRQEIGEAVRCNIPIFYELEEMCAWATPLNRLREIVASLRS